MTTTKNRFGLPVDMVSHISELSNQSYLNRLAEEYCAAQEHFNYISETFETDHVKYQYARVSLEEATRALVSALGKQPSLTVEQSELLGALTAEKKNLDEANDEWRVDLPDGSIKTVRASSEKDAIAKALKNLAPFAQRDAKAKGTVKAKKVN